MEKINAKEERRTLNWKEFRKREQLREAKRLAIKAAKDLGYPNIRPTVIKDIKNAKTEGAVSVIMVTCRHMF